VQGIDQLLPDPKGPNAIQQGPSEKVQVEQIKAQASLATAQVTMKLGVMKLIKEADLNQAKIKHLEAQAIKALEEAKGITTGTEVSVIQAQLDTFRTHHESLMTQIETMNMLADKLGQQEQAATATPAA
jgi:kynurenine formamidase